MTWDIATLDRYIVAPKQVVPGITMGYAGLKKDTQQRVLVGHLTTQKHKRAINYIGLVVQS